MEEQVKLPSSSYDEVAKVIAGYARADREASLDDIARLTGLHRTMISANNGFLTSIGLIEGGNRKTVTTAGRQLGLAIEHNQQEEIATQWRQIASESAFLKNLVSAVRIRRGMDSTSLRAHVAYSAGLSKTKGVMTGTGTVIEVLKVAGLLFEQDGKIVASSEVPSSIQDHVVTPSVAQSRPTTASTQISSIDIPIMQTSVPVSIQISIACGPDDLGELGKKLKALLDDLRQSDQGAG